MRKYGMLFTVLLAVLLLAGCAKTAEVRPETSGPASAAGEINRENAEAYGICGENLVWYYKDQILVIRGQGPMDDYSPLDYREIFYAAPPWLYDETDEDTQRQIQWVFVEDGVTSIGANAFSNATRTEGFSQLSKVVLPDTVTSIGNGAFEYCSALTSINMPANLEEIGRNAFDGCKSLPEIQISENVRLPEQGISDITQVVTVPADAAGK